MCVCTAITMGRLLLCAYSVRTAIVSSEPVPVWPYGFGRDLDDPNNGSINLDIIIFRV